MNDMPTEEFTQACKDAEFFETPQWAAQRILDFELLTKDVLDPCAGRGVLGDALEMKNYVAHEYDLNKWPGAAQTIKTPFNFLDEWSDISNRLARLVEGQDDFSVMMNPPFSKACEFVERSLELGARKILMFQRMAFLESYGRSDFFRELPPTRVWVCGDRATCWRGDIPAEDVVDHDGQVIFKGKKGRSAPTPHAWFVWERGHVGTMSVHHLYKDRESSN